MLEFLKSRKFHSALGWIVSVLLLSWVVVQVDWAVVVNEIQQLNYWYLVPLTFFFVSHYLLKAIRWRYLLDGGEHIPIRTLFESLMIGNFATFVLPLRAGEFIRPYILSKDSDIPFARSFSSIVIERFFDLTTVLILFAIVIQILPTLPDWASHGAFLLSILGLGIFTFMLVGAFLPKFAMSVTDLFLTPIPKGFKDKIRNFLASLLAGTAVLRSLKRLALVVIYSALVWASCWAIFHSGLYLFDGEWTGLMSLTLVVVVALAVAAPSAPGFIGVLQTACVATLTLFNVSKETALAYSLIIHAHQFICICVYGTYLVSKRQLTLKSLSKSTFVE